MVAESFGTNLGPIIGQKGDWTAPHGNEVVYENMRSPFGCEFCGGDVEHVGEVAKAVAQREG